MSEETKQRIAELEKQLTPRGAYECARNGAQTLEGKRFAEVYEEILRLEKESEKN